MRLGLIVNPIAGVGGPLGLKGSDDGVGALMAAMGGCAASSHRATIALSALTSIGCAIITSAGQMGEDAARAAGLAPTIVHSPNLPTGHMDTIAAARDIAATGVDLIAFAGGDGTARDLLAADLGTLPVLGIPAGVKMHSAVFATSPASAGSILIDWHRGRGRPPVVADVMDRDADGAIRLFGALYTPRSVGMQAAKATMPGNPAGDLERVATSLARQLRDEPLVIVGPGSTMMMVKRGMAGTGTLLGVDAYARGTPVAIDADAATLRTLTCKTPPRLILGVIGGQGFVLGRGNQQIDATVIDRARARGLTVLADAAKLGALRHGTLLVDSGDADLDRAMEAYIRVHTAPGRSTMMKLRAA